MMERRSFLALALSLPLTSLTLSRDAHAKTKRYRTRGVVKHIAKDRTRLRIRHEDIPGFMKAMTMPFDTAPSLIAGVAVGDHVEFTFDAPDDGPCVIVALTRVAHATK